MNIMKNIFLDFIIASLKMVGFVKHMSFPLVKRTKNRSIIEVPRPSTDHPISYVDILVPS